VGKYNNLPPLTEFFLNLSNHDYPAFRDKKLVKDLQHSMT